MPLHFLGCDRQGNVATFEFLNGKFVCHVDETLPVTALTNDTYKDSVNCLKQYTGLWRTCETIALPISTGWKARACSD